MITWRSPMFFAGLAILPAASLLLWWALQRRRGALLRFAEDRLLYAIAPGLDAESRRHQFRAALLLLSVFLLILSLAGPQWGFQWEEVHREGVDIVVALDTSRSMLAEDVKPNRLERAKLGLQDLVRQLNGDRIGLIAFAGTAFTQCPLTLDYSAFTESLKAISVGIIPKGGTAVGEAIRTAIKAFEGHQGRHTAIILITDGEDHDGELQEASKEAADLGVHIYTVGIGSSEGDLIPITENGQQTFVKDRKGQVVKSRLDERGLQAIAAATGGAYARAAGPSLGLDQIYRDHVSKLEKRTLDSTMQKRFEQRFQIPLVAALIGLSLESLVGVGLFARGTRRPRASNHTAES